MQIRKETPILNCPACRTNPNLLQHIVVVHPEMPGKETHLHTCSTCSTIVFSCVDAADLQSLIKYVENR